MKQIRELEVPPVDHESVDRRVRRRQRRVLFGLGLYLMAIVMLCLSMILTSWWCMPAGWALFAVSFVALARPRR